MKKICLILFLCIFITACSIENREISTSHKKNAQAFGDEEMYKIIFSDKFVLSKDECKIFCPIVEFESGWNELEDRINQTLSQAVISWPEKNFRKNNLNTNNIEVFCHTGSILSVGQSYVSESGYITNDYVTVDMTTGERIFLNDLIADEDKLIEVLQDGKTVTTSREAFTLEQDDANEAVRKNLKETSKIELKEMLRQCSLDQSEFPQNYQEEAVLPYVFKRPSFYMQSDQLVIEYREEWHSKIIIKYKDIKDALSPDYVDDLIS